jgi:S1-C subfamily serine protease
LGVQLQEVNPALEARGQAAAAAPIYLKAVSVLGSEQYRPKGSPKIYPAEIAGLKAGDKFVSVNGHLVHGTKDLMREIIATGPARIASLEIERDGKLLRLPVLLTRNPVSKPAVLINQMFIQEDQPPPVDLEKAGSKP